MDKTFNYKLSICIPTFNRAHYLERLLESVFQQVSDLNVNNDQIELVVLDNNSQDTTESLCEYFKSTLEDHSWFKYIRHRKNLGMDGNFRAAYERAQGRFFWLLGDDEEICSDSLRELLTLFENNESAIYFLKPYYIRKSSSRYKALSCKNKISYHNYSLKEAFIEKVGVYFTFISSIIIDRQVSHINVEDYSDFEGTKLYQMSWVFSSLLSGTNFTYVSSPMVIAQQDNSGGYNVVKVFSQNLLYIVNYFFDNDQHIKKMFSNYSLFFVIPFFYNDKIGTRFDKSDAISLIDKSYANNIYYRAFFSKVIKYPKILKYTFHFLKRIFF
ncbi:glycosyltransferase family 2 protein [Shewanella avicenniae]|uniref:Glycosyltransferase family 2 protein n=1 Tax=Shewanella avicenniae TaxID=2814294 RepID=A0ABX7QMM1_9GAMM|nr:glycosyltransferase family 2 protein [Shewanella avicenniae]QSX32687.1 glycosyltransferase family 2 protein [Shewanella avicenniae]